MQTEYTAIIKQQDNWNAVTGKSHRQYTLSTLGHLRIFPTVKEKFPLYRQIDA